MAIHLFFVQHLLIWVPLISQVIRTSSWVSYSSSSGLLVQGDGQTRISPKDVCTRRVDRRGAAAAFRARVNRVRIREPQGWCAYIYGEKTRGTVPNTYNGPTPHILLFRVWLVVAIMTNILLLKQVEEEEKKQLMLLPIYWLQLSVSFDPRDLPASLFFLAKWQLVFKAIIDSNNLPGVYFIGTLFYIFFNEMMNTR